MLLKFKVVGLYVSGLVIDTSQCVYIGTAMRSHKATSYNTEALRLVKRLELFVLMCSRPHQ